MTEKMLDFEVDGKRIPAAFTSLDRTPEWCVVLIAGSGPADIDGNYPEGGMWPGVTNILRDLAHQFAEQGVACFRFSRANHVTVDEKKAEAFKRFDHRVIEAAAACRLAKELSGGPKVAVAGHSEGSVVGSMLSVSTEFSPDVFISLSGPAHRFYDLMLLGAERHAVDGVMHLGPMKVPVDLYRKGVEAARNGTAAPEELKTAMPFGFHTMPPDAQAYLRGYDAVDNRETIARVNCPVLVVQGGSDQSVWFENGELLAAARPGAATAFFPELDHFYKKDGSKDLDDRVVRAIVEWLKVCRS